MKNNGLHFLIAEDDSNDALLLVRALEKQFPGSSMYVAKNGADAIKYLSGQGTFADRNKFRVPDVLITDLNMPRVTGLELLTWMQDHPEYRVSPCFMLSGSLEGQEILSAYRLGISAYLTKPATVDDWQRIVGAINRHYEDHCKREPEPQAHVAAKNPVPASPSATGIPRRVQIEIGDMVKQSFECDVVFPSGMRFRVNGQDVSSRFQSREEARFEVYEGEVPAPEPLPIRVEREQRSPRHCKLRVMSKGRLLHVCQVGRCRTTRESVFELLMPGLFVVLVAYYAFIHDPTVGKFYTNRIMQAQPVEYEKDTLPKPQHVQLSALTLQG